MVTMTVGQYLLVLVMTGTFGIILGVAGLGLGLAVAQHLPLKKRQKPIRVRIPVQNLATNFGRRP